MYVSGFRSIDSGFCGIDSGFVGIGIPGIQHPNLADTITHQILRPLEITVVAEVGYKLISLPSLSSC
jgi:hypothetical protein